MFILIQKIIFYSPYKTENRHGDDDDADTAVDEPDAAHIEPRTHFVDDIGDEKPPAHRPDEYREVPHYMMPQLRLGQEEVEPGKQTNVEEENERVGKGEQKGGNEILRIGIDRGIGLANVLGGVLPVEVEPETDQHQAAQHLQHALVGLDKVDDYRHAQAREQGIYEIGKCGPQPRDKARPSAFVECALDTQYTYRPHGRRYQYAYGQSPDYRV